MKREEEADVNVALIKMYKTVFHSTNSTWGVLEVFNYCAGIILSDIVKSQILLIRSRNLRRELYVDEGLEVIKHRVIRPVRVVYG